MSNYFEIPHQNCFRINLSIIQSINSKLFAKSDLKLETNAIDVNNK